MFDWLFNRDYVILRHYDGKNSKQRVEWICGTPWAAPYLEDTRRKLLPRGNIDSVALTADYIIAWFPASDGMQRYFDGEA